MWHLGGGDAANAFAATLREALVSGNLGNIESNQMHAIADTLIRCVGPVLPHSRVVASLARPAALRQRLIAAGVVR